MKGKVSLKLIMTPCIGKMFTENAKQILPQGPICYAVWRMARLES